MGVWIDGVATPSAADGRALSINPSALLLDEPCSGLDERETEVLGALLRSVADEGRAVVLVEHDTELVLRVCTTVHVLDFGEVIASGSPEAIRHDPAVQEAYLGQVQPPSGVDGP